MQRIVIVGGPGCGKTTLARTLSERQGMPFVELDALYWGPGWTPVPDAVFRQRVLDALGGECWCAGGNYSRVRDVIWARADTLVWLDYPLRMSFGWLFKRTVRRIHTREELWAGNRETVRGAFFSRDSLLVYALTTHTGRRKKYALLLGQPIYQHLEVLRFCSPGEMQEWLVGR